MLVYVIDFLGEFSEGLHLSVALLLFCRNFGRWSLIIHHMLNNLLDACHIARLLRFVALDFLFQAQVFG